MYLSASKDFDAHNIANIANNVEIFLFRAEKYPNISANRRLCAIFLVISRLIITYTQAAMSVIRVKDKTFKTFIPEREILERIKVVADKINQDMADKNPLFLAVLNGSFMFAADLMRMITVPCEISFVKLASYEGTSSTGNVQDLIGVNVPLEGRTVIVLEDIIETGNTLGHLVRTLKGRQAADVRICSLLLKPERLKVPLKVDYVVKEIPNDFIVGYGLDYDQQGRNLRDIYTIVEED